MRYSSHWLVGLGFFCFCIFAFLALALTSHGLLFNNLIRFDHMADSLVAPLRSDQDLTQCMLVMTYLGNPEIIIAFEACLLAVIVIVHRKRIAALFLAGIILGELTSLVFKSLLVRIRPTTLLHIVAHGYSFPSGHALLSTVFYGCLGFFLSHILHKKWQKILTAIITTLVIFFVGFSRIFLGVHWTSDVIGGWALGGAFLALIAAIFFHIHKHSKGERITDLNHKEIVGLSIVALALGFFLVYFFVTHIAEVRSIV
jgi:membrane-associated phospholipid phosphatase